MNLDQLLHVLRAASDISGEKSMPKDLMSRAQLHYLGDITAICPDLHDLCVSKCVAGRENEHIVMSASRRHLKAT